MSGFLAQKNVIFVLNEDMTIFQNFRNRTFFRPLGTTLSGEYRAVEAEVCAVQSCELEVVRSCALVLRFLTYFFNLVLFYFYF